MLFVPGSYLNPTMELSQWPFRSAMPAMQIAILMGHWHIVAFRSPKVRNFRGAKGDELLHSQERQPLPVPGDLAASGSFIVQIKQPAGGLGGILDQL